MFEFYFPWLLALLPLPIFMRWFPARNVSEPALRVPFFQQFKTLSSKKSAANTKRYKTATLWLIWILCVFAVAEPRWTGEPQSLPYTGRDLMLAVDISGSMDRQDMKPLGMATMQFQNKPYMRLDAVKAVVGEFAKRRTGDRLGLILFGSQAYLQAPLTHDNNTVNQLLQEAQIGFAGGRTAIGDAIGLAVKRLRERPDGSRRLILLTDGENTAGVTNPIKAAELASTLGIKIYTIGFGASEMIEQTFRGPRRVNPSRELDEGELQTIADMTGGAYFRAHSTDELEEIHAKLDALEPIELDAVQIRPITSLFYWPLGLALILSVALALSQLLPRVFHSQKVML